MFYFTALNNFDVFERFDGYESVNDALEAQERLSEKGFSYFSFPCEE